MVIVVDPRCQPGFRFIGMSIVGLSIYRLVSFVIDKAALMGANDAVGFFGLSLW